MYHLHKRHLYLLWTILLTVALGSLLIPPLQAQEDAEVTPIIKTSTDRILADSGQTITVTVIYTPTAEIVFPITLYYTPPEYFTVSETNGEQVNGEYSWTINDPEPISETVVLVTEESIIDFSGSVIHSVRLDDDAPQEYTIDIISPLIASAPEAATVEAGSSLTLTILLTNNSESIITITDIRIVNDTFSLEGATQTDIEAGSAATLEPELTVTDDTLADEYQIQIEATYTYTEVERTTITDPITITVTAVEPPNYVVTNQDIEDSGNGEADLIITFENNGGPATDSRLRLTYPSDSLTILSPSPEKDDNGSAEWSLADGQGELRIRLEPTENFSENSRLIVGFYQDEEPVGPEVPLDPSTIADLVAIIVPQSADPQSDNGTPTPSEPGAAPTNASPGELDESSDGISQTALVIIAVVIILFIGILLAFVMRSRQRASLVQTGGPGSSPTARLEEPTNIPEPPPASSPISTPVSRPAPASTPIPGAPVSKPTPATAPYLEDNQGRTFPLTSLPFTIGRGADNSLPIDESFDQWQTVSRQHAQIAQHQQGYFIEDLGSQNKLHVQGRLTERNLVRNGWGVMIGGVEFTFYDGSGRQS